MNLHAVKAIYRFEMGRWLRTLGQSLFSPVLSTSLYFIVFGSAIGSRMASVCPDPNLAAAAQNCISYGAFIVPGLIMLSILTESVSNGSFGIYMPRWAGTIYELLSAPVAPIEAVMGYTGAAATKSVVIGLVILATARFFVEFEIAHPAMMLLFLVLTSVTFCLFGFILGVLANGFEQLNIVPMLILTPLTFLGGTFYSLSMLPPVWQEITKLNPIVYLISGFRWAFYDVADVSVATSLTAVAVFLAVCMSAVYWIFHTGYRLKQ
ncbi:MAG: ABC transporter permease [Hyphomonadaceae bacterium]|nr:ABC transporter permease [Hyphomonadaceae bacterium]